MKLIVQIPCLNEEETLPPTVRDIPRQIDGIDEVEVLIVDDGCTDRTVEVAREAGVDHIVRFPQNRGLGHAFQAGIDACLRLGADIIVNTDGDNQYFGGDIPKLIRPILEGKADLVIGDREPEKIGHFSFTKKLLQRLGSRVVSRLSGIPVPDVASGFRAFNRNAAMRLSSFTDFDHTVDHVIQAGKKRLAVVNVPIRTNAKFRESRLFSSVYQFVARSLGIMVRVYASYAALKMFAVAGALTFSIGALLGLRFLYYFLLTPEGYTHVQSLILCAILLLAGFQMVLTGIVADLIAANRSLIEDVAYRVKRLEMEKDGDRGSGVGDR
ncbi:MAG: glycosyltransferase family 2 protein [Candidatus Latescibacteria bacterium]|nr:glycosyltransferase family 2 protein [Candidatus Latescibacterota bacterium]